MTRPTGAQMRAESDAALAVAGVLRARRKTLTDLGRRWGVDLPPMPVGSTAAGSIHAIHRAEQALIAEGIDPGAWTPPARRTP